MTTHDPAVFRPSSGPLMLRGNIASGPAPTPKPPRTADRCSSRFGNLSMNSFFARHNPHPVRVKHIKGLLDIPICAVQDDGYFANPRYSLQFPPNNFNNQFVKSYSKYYGGSQQGTPPPMPVGSVNVNSQTMPVNTITGLQNFLGKSMNMRVFRKNVLPKAGLVPVQEVWRDELHALTQAALTNDQSAPTKAQTAPQPPSMRTPARNTPKPRSSGYSAVSGRLNENPAARTYSRASRGGIPVSKGGRQEEISENMDIDGLHTAERVFQMLSQILQTDDPTAVKNWLVSAGDREKNSVLEMIRTVLANKESYYSHDVPEEYVKEQVAGDILGDGSACDQLNVHDTTVPSHVKEGQPVLPAIITPPKTPVYERAITPVDPGTMTPKLPNPDNF